jgi:hypothetical protein
MDRRRSSHIVPEIYEATIDPSHWDYTSACLYYKNKDMEFASTIAQYGLPDSQRMNFGDQCDSLDHMFCERGSGASESPECTQFYPGSNGVMPPDSEIYLQWMKPNGYFHVGGAQFVDSESHKAGIAILRDQATGVWSDGELRAFRVYSSAPQAGCPAQGTRSPRHRFDTLRSQRAAGVYQSHCKIDHQPAPSAADARW